MLMSEIDFRFIEIEYEIDALDEYIKLLEEQLGNLLERERERYNAKKQEKIYQTDEAERQIANHEFCEYTEHLLPRFFRNPLLVTLWATFESAINEIAQYLQAEKQLELKINDIRGNNFLKQAQKYYDHILKFPLCIDEESLKRVEMLRVLRNAVAHSNSRINAVRSDDDRRQINSWIKQRNGVSLSSQALIFSEDFIKEAYVTMREIITSLLSRVREGYPDKTYEKN